MASCVTLEDVMSKLLMMESQLGTVSQTRELKGEIFDLKAENEALRKDVESYKEECGSLEQQTW